MTIDFAATRRGRFDLEDVFRPLGFLRVVVAVLDAHESGQEPTLYFELSARFNCYFNSYPTTIEITACVTPDQLNQFRPTLVVKLRAHALNKPDLINMDAARKAAMLLVAELGDQAKIREAGDHYEVSLEL